MLFNTSIQIQNQEIHLPILKDKKVSLFLKREDKIHPFVSGNKYRKLKYNIEKARQQQQQTRHGIFLKNTTSTTVDFHMPTGSQKQYGMGFELFLFCRATGHRWYIIWHILALHSIFRNRTLMHQVRIFFVLFTRRRFRRSSFRPLLSKYAINRRPVLRVRQYLFWPC